MKTSKYSLLIVIPSAKERIRITDMMNNEFINSVAVSSEQEAVTELQQRIPDLIILDIGDSISRECPVVRQLRKNENTRNIPVLLLTSIKDETSIPECIYYGNIDFITKPFRKRELILRIKRQLSLLQAQRIIKKQNEKIKKTIEFKDKLYSVIAHDLRAPIGTIKMINDTIESKKNQIEDPEIWHLFKMANETTNEAFNLLENLLRWSRNQSGKTKVIPVQFNLSDTVRQVISLFASIANAKNIKLHNNVPANLITYADEDMIKTVIRNLISNAIKFTYPGGNVTIEASSGNNIVIFSVKDDGLGMSQEIQNNLLKNGKSFSSYGTKNEKGSGLGMVLCREFLKANQGKLWFTSEEKQGSTFSFSLPSLAIPAKFN